MASNLRVASGGLFEDDDLSTFDGRLKTFRDWPLTDEDSKCTPEKLADAGMYKVDSAAEPDLVRCYFCLRELDGWEVSDEPWDEHKRKPCPFIAKGKRARDLTLQDFLELEFERVVINYRQSLKDEEVELGKEAAVIKASIEDMTKPVKKPRARKRKY